jgi:hypothetical protein
MTLIAALWTILPDWRVVLSNSPQDGIVDEF